MIMTIVIILVICIKKARRNRVDGNNDDFITWTVSLLIVLVISLYFLSNASKNSLKESLDYHKKTRDIFDLKQP